MGLRNAFDNLSTETTTYSHLVDSITVQRELLQQIVVQLKILNTHMEMINNENIADHDLDLDERELS